MCVGVDRQWQRERETETERGGERNKTVQFFNQQKVLIFVLLLHRNTCCGYSLEVLMCTNNLFFVENKRKHFSGYPSYLMIMLFFSTRKYSYLSYFSTETYGCKHNLCFYREIRGMSKRTTICMTSEDSDQPAHLRSLIRVLADQM